MSTTIIGIDKFYFAKMLDEQLETYDTPVYIAPVQELSIEPETDSASQYGDNRAIETASAMGSIKGTVKFTGISGENEALILGHKQQEGKLIKSAEDVAPLGAVLYRRMKADGSYRYKVLYRGRFSLPKEETTTKEDKIDFQSAEFEVNFMPRLKDSIYEFQIDNPDKDTDPWKTAFFAKVIEPSLTASPTP